MSQASPRGPAPPGLVVAAMRGSASRALAAVARRIGDFDDAEDAVQEALASAARQWPREGIPDNPTAWLITVATRRAIDGVRSDAARRERERRTALLEADAPLTRHIDDTLAVYLMCCHPVLSRPLQIVLTLRAVAGLTTREIARGLLLAETTVAQRISRAKEALRRADASFTMPDSSEMPERVGAVLDVLGVVHTESHTAAEGDAISRPSLAADALRIARDLLERTSDAASWRGELQGLVALMLLTEARAPARVDADGDPVPLGEQDRTRWRQDLIAEGDALLVDTLTTNPLGPFQLKAAIAGVHAAAPSYDETDWREILHLYDLLGVLDPSPVVVLGRLVAYAEVAGADGALTALAELELADRAVPRARIAAVRAHLLQRAGRDASVAYREAARLSRNGAERRWLERRSGSAQAH